MDHQTVFLKLPQRLLRDVSSIACAQDVTIGHLVRDLLKDEVDRRLKRQMPDAGSDQQGAGVRALLATEMTLADGWEDLLMRLCEHGYELRPAGTGAAIYRRPCGTHVCNSDALGFSYQALANRFECAMPGHPQGKMKCAVEMSLPTQPGLPFEGDTTFEVIEFDA